MGRLAPRKFQNLGSMGSTGGAILTALHLIAGDWGSPEDDMQYSNKSADAWEGQQPKLVS